MGHSHTLGWDGMEWAIYCTVRCNAMLCEFSWTVTWIFMYWNGGRWWWRRADVVSDISGNVSSCILIRLIMATNVLVKTRLASLMRRAAQRSLCVNASLEIHWVTSAAHPIPSQRSAACVCVCVCVCVNLNWLSAAGCVHAVCVCSKLDAVTMTSVVVVRGPNTCVVYRSSSCSTPVPKCATCAVSNCRVVTSANCVQS